MQELPDMGVHQTTERPYLGPAGPEPFMGAQSSVFLQQYHRGFLCIQSMEPCWEAQPKLYGMESAAYDSMGHMERKYKR